jgi:hypothetical protein
MASATVPPPPGLRGSPRRRRRLQRDLGDHLDQALELLVAGDEVGLGVDLDHGRPWCPRSGDADRPSAATRPAFLAAFDRPFLRSQVDRSLHVAVGLGQR